MIADRRSNLLADLDAFLGEHRDCGELTSGVEGDRVWMACECGARIEREAGQMEFRLYYRGRLRATGSAKEKQELRRYFHRQLRTLWAQPPLSDHMVHPVATSIMPPPELRKQLGPFCFIPLVNEFFGGIAELDVLFLRPQAAGAIVSSGGDIDNRIKTLLDSLRVPKSGELQPEDCPGPNEDPFFCLLEDDVLVTRLAVTSDQLLEAADPGEVLLVIHVLLKQTGKKRFWSFP